MTHAEAMRQVAVLLDALDKLGSVSDFQRRYYHLLADRIAAEGGETPLLSAAFVTFLDRELRHRRQLRNLAAQESVDDGEVISLADKRRISLTDTLSLLSGLAARHTSCEATVRLLMAECHRCLNLVDRAVADLETAIRLGVDDALVHFALGFCRCLLAQQAFTARDPETQEPVVVDPERYRAALLDAVAAFEEGLGSGDLDASLYWWIGNCLRCAGFLEAANEAYAETDLEEPELPHGDDDLPSERAEGRKLSLPQITESEIAQVAEQLKRPHSRADLLRNTEWP